MYKPIEFLRGKLIVSVRVCPDKPVYHPETMAQITRAAQIGGAAAIRCQGLVDISVTKGRIGAPVIGLWKKGHEDVYVTLSLCHACACIVAGCDIITVDATSRPRLNGRIFAETCQTLHEESASVMADCDSFEDAKVAYEAGTDIISTTLTGYAGGHERSVGPDLGLLKETVVAYPDAAAIYEGRTHTPQDAVEAINMGAFAVIVDTGTTYPTLITTWFKDAVEER